MRFDDAAVAVLQGIREWAAGFNAFLTQPAGFMVGFRLLALLLVGPHPLAVFKVHSWKFLREYRRVFISAVASLPGLPEPLRSPISKERNLGEDGVDGGVYPAVSLRRVRMEISPAVGSREFWDAAGGIREPDDAEVYGAARAARRRIGAVEFAPEGDAVAARIEDGLVVRVTAEILRFAPDDNVR